MYAFPLTVIRELTPLNAEAVLERFESFNLRGVFSGHFHGQTCEERGAYTPGHRRCCSRVANNHDGTLRKGYWLVEAKPEARSTDRSSSSVGRRSVSSVIVNAPAGADEFLVDTPP